MESFRFTEPLCRETSCEVILGHKEPKMQNIDEFLVVMNLK